MRILLTLFKWLGIFLLLSIVALVAFPQLPVLKDGLSAGKAKAYLEAEAVTLDLKATDGGLEFPEEFYSHRFIMLNEIHGYADVQRFDLAMMMHLHERTGWRVYLGEISPAQAIAFNDYVLGGSDAAVRAVFDSWADQVAQWGNKEFFGKLTAIREFNATQAENDRIVFVGVDLMSQEEASKRLMDRPAPLVAPAFDSTEGIRAINHVLLEEAAARTVQGRYTEILTNIDRVLTFPGGRRERFYALWGLFHGGQTTILGNEPLALRLNKEGGLFEDEVASVISLCLADCLNMMPARGLPGPFQGKDGEEYSLIPMTFDNPYLARVRGAGEVLDRLGEDKAVLIPLRKEGSPYADGPRLSVQTGYLAMLQPFTIDGSAADAFDAALLHRGSAALTPWRGEAFDVTAQR